MEAFGRMRGEEHPAEDLVLCDLAARSTCGESIKSGKQARKLVVLR
jgi:hypothetical protein